ncbi:MAG: hypothetical protein A3A44_01335 [Candidatus Sungbacteria bacterium RIFCSPLOWO2_01_FULL_60_25]|uniref:Uncharacterized protein n=1 Tax=Candidatus Sungbacteria bacterium RIFCSPLOWO2_01_FULL_60_25 TaxID=1802281 RepID=A0A1G2LDK6_9BACT|nr:MAG: hypothetical protein A3A44_01335 [Candidatus Sungbacteria bacterium RIFCSPLOWO2_01_FULL_60_25]
MGRRNRNGNGKGVPAPGIGAPGQKHYFAVVDGKVCRVRIVRKQEAPDMWLVMLKNGDCLEVATKTLSTTREQAAGYKRTNHAVETAPAEISLSVAPLPTAEEAVSDLPEPDAILPGPPPADEAVVALPAPERGAPSGALTHEIRSSHRAVIVNAAPAGLPSAQRSEPPRLRIRTFFFPGSRPGVEFR